MGCSDLLFLLLLVLLLLIFLLLVLLFLIFLFLLFLKSKYHVFMMNCRCLAQLTLKTLLSRQHYIYVTITLPCHHHYQWKRRMRKKRSYHQKSSTSRKDNSELVIETGISVQTRVHHQIINSNNFYLLFSWVKNILQKRA